jgi:putative aldouronate transport system permease protein
MKRSFGEKLFEILNIGFMIGFSILCIYPFIYVTALSFNDGMDAMRGGIYFFPRVFTLENYESIFKDKRIVGSSLISVYRTFFGALFAVLFNSCYAYAISKKNLPGRKFFNWLMLIPMYFGAGIIPYFLVCKQLGLVNNILVYVIPAIAAPFYIMLLRVFYADMPISLEESAKLDGAGYFTIFFKIYFPLSIPALATVALLSGIAHWNDWFDGTIMMFNSRLWPLQTLLLNILQGADIMSFFKGKNLANVGAVARKTKITVESIKMAMLVFTVAPIILIYPFLQKYFMKGMMIGSVKG